MTYDGIPNAPQVEDQFSLLTILSKNNEKTLQDAQPVPKDETGQPGQFSDWQPMNAEVENIAYLAS